MELYVDSLELARTGGLSGVNREDCMLESVLNLQDAVLDEHEHVSSEYAEVAVAAGVINQLQQYLCSQDEEVRGSASEALDQIMGACPGWQTISTNQGMVAVTMRVQECDFFTCSSPVLCEFFTLGGNLVASFLIEPAGVLSRAQWAEIAQHCNVSCSRLKILSPDGDVVHRGVPLSQYMARSELDKKAQSSEATISTPGSTE